MDLFSSQGLTNQSLLNLYKNLKEISSLHTLSLIFGWQISVWNSKNKFIHRCNQMNEQGLENLSQVLKGFNSLKHVRFCFIGYENKGNVWLLISRGSYHMGVALDNKVRKLKNSLPECEITVIKSVEKILLLEYWIKKIYKQKTITILCLMIVLGSDDMYWVKTFFCEEKAYHII